MFRIVAYVDDKKLGDALRALTGMARGAPEVTPVTNISIKGGALHANGNGNIVDMYAAHLAKHKLQITSSKETTKWLTDNGLSRLSVSYVLKSLRDRGILKPKGKGNYAVAPQRKETK